MSKVIISLFDFTGNWCAPYRAAGYEVHQLDIKLGHDIFNFNPAQFVVDYQKRGNYLPPRIGLLIAIPCTDYAISGARHFAAKDKDGRTEQSQRIVEKVKSIIDWFTEAGLLELWALENPMSRIHTLNTWLGAVKHKFNPCDYAGLSDTPDSERYNKATWLWGKFNKPVFSRLEPIYKENPGWRNLGGKSERTKTLRSTTPLGFARAFYEANQIL